MCRIRTKRRLAGLMLIVAVSVLDVCQGFAADTLVLKQPPGVTLKYQKEQRTEQVLTINGTKIETVGGTFAVVATTAGAPDAEGNQSVVEKYEVLQSEIVLPGVKYQFDSANPDQEPPSPQLKPFASLFRMMFNTPTTTRLTPEGKVLEVIISPESRAELDPAFAEVFEAEKMKQTAENARNVIPGRAVNPGETWDLTTVSYLGAGQTLTIKTKCTYEGSVAGAAESIRRVTVKPLTVDFRMDPNTPSPLKVTASDLKITEGTGDYDFDLSQGAIVRGTSKVVIGGTLTLQAGGQELPGQLDLTLTTKSQLQPQ